MCIINIQLYICTIPRNFSRFLIKETFVTYDIHVIIINYYIFTWAFVDLVGLIVLKMINLLLLLFEFEEHKPALYILYI